MIGYISGVVVRKTGDMVIVETSGVGYAVSVGKRTSMGMSEGDKVVLWVYTHVREDALSLYGFEEWEERELYVKLLAVSGVGPKVALAVMTTGRSGEIVAAIREANVEFFTAVSGIGKKGAQRIIVEMKSKVRSTAEMELGDSPEREDAMRGLMTLGLSKQEALVRLKGVDAKMSAPMQIKVALKNNEG